MKAFVRHGLASVLATSMMFSIVGAPIALAVDGDTSTVSSTTVTGSTNGLSSLLSGLTSRLNSSNTSSTSSKGVLKVVKVDADNRTVKLSGAEFAVIKDTNGNGTYDAGTDQMVGSMTESGTSGEYELSGLDAGTYFVQETKAPTDYELNPNVYKAELKVNGEVTATPAETNGTDSTTGTNGNTTNGNSSVIDPSVLSEILQQTINTTNQSIAKGLTTVASGASNDLSNLSLNKFVSEDQIQSLVDALSTQAKTTVNQGYSSLVPVLNQTYGLGKNAILMIANLLLSVLTDADDSALVDGLVNFGTGALGSVATALGGEATGTALSEGSRQLINGGIALLASIVSAFQPIITNLMNSGLDTQALEFVENIIGNILQSVTGSSVIDSVADAGISTAYNIADGILQAGGATAAQANQAIAQTVANLIQNPALGNSVTGIADTMMNVFNTLNPLNTLQIGSDQQGLLATALNTLTGIANVSGLGNTSGILGMLTNAQNGLTSSDVRVEDATIEIADTHKKGDVVIDKNDTKTNDPVSGATYTVYQDTDGNGKFNSSVDQAVTNIGDTTEDGHYVGTVNTGTYFITETTAADGYKKDNNIYKVTIETVEEEKVPVVSGTVSIPQNASEGNAQVVLTDTKNNNASVETTPLGTSGSDAKVFGVPTDTSGGTTTTTTTQGTTTTTTSGDGSTTTTTANQPATVVETVPDNSGNDDPVVEAKSTPDTGVSVMAPIALMATSSVITAGLYVTGRKEKTDEES